MTENISNALIKSPTLSPVLVRASEQLAVTERLLEKPTDADFLRRKFLFESDIEFEKLALEIIDLDRELGNHKFIDVVLEFMNLSDQVKIDNQQLAFWRRTYKKFRNTIEPETALLMDSDSVVDQIKSEDINTFFKS